MRRLRAFALAGLVVLLATTHKAAAQGDWGTLEVLVEGASGADGTPSLTFETRTVPRLDTIDVGPGRSFTDSGERLGTGAGRVVTPTVTVSELVTEASVYPRMFRHVTKDAQGRIWTTAKDPGGLFFFSKSSSWQRVSLPLGPQYLDRDAQGRLWVIGNGDIVYRISGTTVTEYKGFEDLGIGHLFALAVGSGDTVWMGGYSLEGWHPAALLRFDGREWRRFSLADGLPNYSWIDAVAVDSTGTVWGVPVYDVPDHVDPPASFVPYSLVSYDGREWRGYGFELGRPLTASKVGMLVDPGGRLWVSTPDLLVQQTASGWMEYAYPRRGGGRSMAAERAGRIWMDGGGWIGVFESGQLHRTPSGANLDAFGSPVSQAPKKLYCDGEALWIASSRLARWRLPQPPSSVRDEPGTGASGPSRLLDSYPNPFNARTTIGFELDHGQPVSLRVHNLSGQRVATLAEGVYPEGYFAVSWDGRDDRGREVASGVYLCRLRLAEQVLSHPLTVVR